MSKLGESVKLDMTWSIAKFEDIDGRIAREGRAGASMYKLASKYPDKVIEVREMGHNLMLNNGITVLLNLLIGAAGQTAFTNANSRTGAGDSSTAAVATQTGLQAATNHYWQLADATFPSVSAQTVTWQSTFGGSVANYAWNEFVIDNDGAAGSTSTAPTYSSTLVALNRLVSAQGTKTSGQSWIVQLAITES